MWLSCVRRRTAKSLEERVREKKTKKKREKKSARLFFFSTHHKHYFFSFLLFNCEDPGTVAQKVTKHNDYKKQNDIRESMTTLKVNKKHISNYGKIGATLLDSDWAEADNGTSVPFTT